MKPIICSRLNIKNSLLKHADVNLLHKSQIRELFFIENPELSNDKSNALKTKSFSLFSQQKIKSCVYVYLPWYNRVFRSVDKNDYYKLITNRNRDLISEDEQEKLRHYKVGIFGMSVGSNIALMLARTGFSNFIVADFDTLESTNLNRIFAGIQDVGLAKVEVIGRKIYENNPFAEIKQWQTGVNNKNLVAALKGNQVECVIDEIDDMMLKVQIRVECMKYGVPVVMVTDNGEGVVLHVERYDLGYKKIFGKEKKDFVTKVKKIKDKGQLGELIINDIVGGVQYVDPKMFESVKKVISQKLVSWPQLGSAAMLGAVTLTNMIKAIALEKNKSPNIRIHINPYNINISKH